MVTEISKIFGIGKQAVMQMNRQASLLYNTAGESIKEEETCNHMGSNGKEHHMESVGVKTDCVLTRSI